MFWELPNFQSFCIYSRKQKSWPVNRLKSSWTTIGFPGCALARHACRVCFTACPSPRTILWLNWNMKTLRRRIPIVSNRNGNPDNVEKRLGFQTMRLSSTTVHKSHQIFGSNPKQQPQIILIKSACTHMPWSDVFEISKWYFHRSISAETFMRQREFVYNKSRKVCRPHSEESTHCRSNGHMVLASSSSKPRFALGRARAWLFKDGQK